MAKKSDNFQFYDIPPDILLDRFCTSPMGTFGKLNMRGFSCYTVEQPWANNKPFMSCIPEGIYDLKLRESDVVKRTSKRNKLPYQQGWEISEVPGRDLIMIHIANTKDDISGCIGVGDRLGCVDGKWAVLSSADTFDTFMKALSNSSNHRIEIRRVKI